MITIKIMNFVSRVCKFLYVRVKRPNVENGGRIIGSRMILKSLTGYSAIVLLLAVYWILAVSSTLEKSNTFDEALQITSGYSYWVNNDYRMNPESGNLPQRLSGLPLLFGTYRFPTLDQPLWWKSGQYSLAKQFFYDLGNDPDSMLLKTRAVMALLGVVLGLIVYAWSRRLFGPAGGVLSLVLFVFSPTMLAHGRLGTADFSVALFFVAAAWAWWVVLHRVTPASVLASCVAAAGLFLSKMSAVLFVPMALLMIIICLAGEQRLSVGVSRKWERTIASRIGRGAVLLAVGAIHVVIIGGLIWASFGFRYSVMKRSEPGRDELSIPWEKIEQDPTSVLPVVNFARRHRLLPEAYLYGLAHIARGVRGRAAFLNGRYSILGWRHFFPYCFAVKTPLGLFVILTLAIAAAVAQSRAAQRGEGSNGFKDVREYFYAMVPLWVLLGVYWLFAINSKSNIGARYILPVYPPTLVLAGGAVYWFRTRWKIVKAVLVLALLSMMAASILVWPHYLEFFNLVGGGSRKGYKHLVDSSLDWGQDLPALKKWLDSNRPRDGDTPVYLSYFGTASPNHYGIRARRLPEFMGRLWKRSDPRPLTGGIYCISATMLQSLYNKYLGPWTYEYEKEYQLVLRLVQEIERARHSPDARKALFAQHDPETLATCLASFDELRFARLCAFLRKRKPDDMVAYTILVYWLSDEDVETALLGAASVQQSP